MDDESILARAIEIFDEYKTKSRLGRDFHQRKCYELKDHTTAEYEKHKMKAYDRKDEMIRYTLMTSGARMIICKMHNVHIASQCCKEIKKQGEIMRCKNTVWSLEKNPLCENHKRQTKRSNTVVESVVQEPKQKMHRVHDACDDDEGGPDIQIDELKNGTDIVAVSKKQQPIIKQKTKFDKIHIIATKMVDDAFAKVFGSSYKLPSEK